MIKNKSQQENGFTLLELLISVSIFIIIVTMAMGSLVIIFQSNRQAAAVSLAVDNASFALDTMQREMRLGRTFSCSGGCTDADNITFEYFDKPITYAFSASNQITKSVDGGPALPLTADKYSVDGFQINMTGTSIKAITLYIEGSVQSGESTSEFDLQTTVSSRQF